MEATVDTRLESATSVEPEVGSRVRLAGGLFVFLAAQFMVVIMLAATLVPGYDMHAAAISDLGVFSQTALLFNSSLVVVGLATFAGGYLLFRWHEAVWLLSFFVLGGLGAILAGVFTLESAPGLHGIGALVAFLFFNLQAIGTATKLDGPMKVLSVFLGVLGLAFVVIMAIGDGGNAAIFGPIGHGGVERMIVYPPMLWLLVVGGYFLGTKTHSE